MSDEHAVRRYRKRPVTDDQVEAVQLLDDGACDWDSIAAWCGGEHRLQEIADSGEYDSYIRIPFPTLGSGYLWATMTDWIVRRELGWMILDAERFAETFEPATAPGNHGVATWTCTREQLIDAIGGLRVMVSLTGPAANLVVADYLADAILPQLPEAEPASLNSAESVNVSAAEREACATEIRRKADEHESCVHPDPVFQRAHLAGMREAARFILAGENPPCVSADVQDGIAATEATAP